MKENNKFTGELKTPEVNKVKKEIKAKSYQVTFLQNRKFELNVGRKIYIFIGVKSHILAEAEIIHSDFIQQQKYFSVKEI